MKVIETYIVWYNNQHVKLHKCEHQTHLETRWYIDDGVFQQEVSWTIVNELIS